MDLNSLGQKIDNWTAVVDSELRNRHAMYFDATPKDVDILDFNGNTVPLPNRAKIKKQLWDDVGGALGRLHATVYVDEVNGDDTNDGTQSLPFKTLNKAANSTPAGLVSVKLLSDITLDPALPIYCYSKTVYIGSADNNTKSITANMGSVSHIALRGSYLSIAANINLNIHSVGTRSFIAANGSTVEMRGGINISGDAIFTYLKGSVFVLNSTGKSYSITNNGLIAKLASTGTFDFYYGGGIINGAPISTPLMKQYIAGLVTNANGSVLNANANVNLA